METDLALTKLPLEKSKVEQVCLVLYSLCIAVFGL